MADYLSIFIKLFIAFAGLWCLTRLLGKREISQLSPFDFISSLILSELVGNTIFRLSRYSIGRICRMDNRRGAEGSPPIR
jgi:uncharacterized membrane protein YcaP (DUF421 family)